MHKASAHEAVIFIVYSTIYLVLVIGMAGSPWADDWFKHKTLSYEIAKGMPAAFIALVAGAIASAIAYRQWLTADRQREISAAKLSLDLFEERYKLYELLWRYLSARTRDLDAVGPVSVELQNSAPKFHFLFGREIGSFVEEAQTRGIYQDTAHRVSRNPRTPGDFEMASGLSADHLWFHEQANGLRARFAGYLDFERWR